MRNTTMVAVVLTLLLLVITTVCETVVILAHYVWINRTDIHTTQLPDYLSSMFHTIHKMFPKTLDIKVHYHADIYAQLVKYDPELANYFMAINPELPALLSDIGRIVTLYNYGGFYHDTKMCMENKIALKELTHYCDLGVHVVFQQKSSHFLHIRNTNILACQKQAPIFHAILQKQKQKLAALIQMPVLKRPQSNVTVYQVGSFSIHDVLSQQSSCKQHPHYTLCQHNGTAVVVTHWKVKDFNTKILYNHKYDLHWSRSNVPLFVNSSVNVNSSATMI